MKRAVAAALGLVVIVSQSIAAGHLYIWNYDVSPYSQVVWDNTVPVVGGSAVNDTGVQIQVWFGKGIIADDALLTSGEITTVNLAYTYNPYPSFSSTDYGPGGYFDQVLQVLPNWAPHETFTFQLRATGDTPYGRVDETLSRSALWQDVGGSSSIPPAHAETVSQLAVAVIPEPATFTLLSLGSVLLLLARRKR